MPAFRVTSLAVIAVALLVPSLALAQKEKEPGVVRLAEGISVRVAPIWTSRPSAAGPTKLELSVVDVSALRMVVYFTVEARRSPSDALQRAAEIAGPPAPEDRLFLVNGWPAVEATRTLDMRQPSQEKEARDEKETPRAAGAVP